MQIKYSYINKTKQNVNPNTSYLLFITRKWTTAISVIRINWQRFWCYTLNLLNILEELKHCRVPLTGSFSPPNNTLVGKKEKKKKCRETIHQTLSNSIFTPLFKWPSFSLLFFPIFYFSFFSISIARKICIKKSTGLGDNCSIFFFLLMNLLHWI